MNDTELLAEMKAGACRGFYFFWGDEDYLKNRRAADMKKLTVGDFAAFDSYDFAFGDEEPDLGAIRDAVLIPPMMSSKTFVSVSFATLANLKEKERDALLGLFSDFSPEDRENTVVVLRVSADGFDAGSPKKPSAFLRSAEKIMKCVEFPYQTEGRLTKWMERHFAEYGLVPEPGVCARIIAEAGRSMYRLSGEVEKTAAYAAARYESGAAVSPYPSDGGPSDGGKTVTPSDGGPSDGRKTVTLSDVAACVSHTDEDDGFGLTNCILDGDAAGALAFLEGRKRRREEPVFVLAQITRTFTDLAAASLFLADGRDRTDFARAMKINDYRAGLCWRAAAKGSPERFAAAVEACAAADRGMKSGSVGYSEIEKLICAQALIRRPESGVRK
ncbi:MAG: hypothetical protein IKQ92_04735 [Clostridia bacterium]|nr:hypothetical protein [Clostridia bacterium]